MRWRAFDVEESRQRSLLRTGRPISNEAWRRHQRRVHLIWLAAALAGAIIGAAWRCWV